MSYLSDPDRLERLAKYVRDEPMNATREELATALDDAAERIRGQQWQLRELLRPPFDQDTDPTPLGTERPTPAGWEPPGRGNALAGAFVAIAIEAVVVLAVVVLAVLL